MAERQRTQGERERDTSLINLLSGIYKSLQSIGSSISNLKLECDCSCKNKCNKK